VRLPERDVAKGWQGRLVLDQDGERLGECTGIFADAASGATEWLEVAVEGHRRCLLPALNALEVSGQVRVAFRRAAVLAAPHVGCRPSSNSLPGGLFRQVIPWWPVT